MSTDCIGKSRFDNEVGKFANSNGSIKCVTKNMISNMQKKLQRLTKNNPVGTTKLNLQYEESKIVIFQNRGRPQGNFNKMENREF